MHSLWKDHFKPSTKLTFPEQTNAKLLLMQLSKNCIRKAITYSFPLIKYIHCVCNIFHFIAFIRNCILIMNNLLELKIKLDRERKMWQEQQLALCSLYDHGDLTKLPFHEVDQKNDC